MSGFFSNKDLKSSVVLRKGGKHPSCISCGLFKAGCESPKLEPVGNNDKEIMLIFDVPTERADTTNDITRGLTSITTLLRKIGVSMEKDCVTISAVRCKPYTKEEENEPRLPTNFEVDSCRHFIAKYIKQFKPKLIITFGKFALMSVIGDRWQEDVGRIDLWRGFVIPDQDFHAFVAPVFDIDLFNDNDNGAVKVIMESDLLNALRYLEHDFPVFKQPKITILNNLSALDEIKSDLAAFDYETTGLKPHMEGHQIVCASIAVDANHVFVFMMPKSENKREPFIRFLQNKRIRKMAHNMKFEETWSDIILGTRVKNWHWDSMQAAHILDNRAGISGLKFQAYVNFGLLDYNIEVKKYLQAIDDKNGNSMNRILEYIKTERHKEELLEYNAMDSIVEYRLALLQQEQFDNILPF